MANITAQNLVDRAGVLIQDATNVRWPQSELLNWLNDGQREIVLLKPESSVKNIAWSLLADATKQAIPTDGVILLNVHRNMGTSGATPGDAIRIVDKEVLDSQMPGWHSATNTLGKIQHYMFDPRDPKTFYVYPKAPAAGSALPAMSWTTPASGVLTITSTAHGLVAGNSIYVTNGGSGTVPLPTGAYVVIAAPTANTFTVAAPSSVTASASTPAAVKNLAVELVYSASPTDCTLAATLSIDDIYANALLDYVLYRAYSKDADYAQNGNLAVAHYQAFSNSLGVKTQNELARNANVIGNGANPNVPSTRQRAQ